MYAKRSKCQFVCIHFDFLGHVLSRESVSSDPKKIETVVRWSVTKDRIEVRRFLGLVIYMLKFMRIFAKIAAPMTDLLKGFMIVMKGLGL